MMRRQDWDQQLFYEFNLDKMIPTEHLLRRINVFATAVLADLLEQLKAFYSDIGRPSVNPELMIFERAVAACMAAGLVKGEVSRRMQASWKPMPAAIIAKRLLFGVQFLNAD